MNVSSFIKIASGLPSDISILVKGDTGIGKSQIVRQIASMIKTNHSYLNYDGEGIPVLDWRLSIFSEGDIIGLPELVDGVTRFAPNDRFISACREPHLLFLDEGNRASTEVLQCAFQIVLDRELNGHKLHPETRIIMAINEGADFTVNEMDPALLRRFWVTELTPTSNDWLVWAAKNNIDRMIQSFIKKYPSHLMHEGLRSPGNVYPYPASWERLDHSLKHMNLSPTTFAGKNFPEEVFSICAGFIGSSTTAAFLDYVKNYIFKLNAEDVLIKYDEFEEDIKALTNDKKNDILDQIIVHLKDNDICVDQMKNLVKFLDQTSDEVVVDFSQNLMATKNIHNIKMITTGIKTRIINSARGIGKVNK